MTPLPPGSTIGILGGGQLGRMLATAAAQLGYHTHVLAPDQESVAAQSASTMTRADYHNRIVLADFAEACDVVTYEFENIAVEPVESKTMKGLDSLYSIVQMPGGIPVGTLAIGKAGAKNAALLGAAILATADAALTEKLIAWRTAQTESVAEEPA